MRKKNAKIDYAITASVLVFMGAVLLFCHGCTIGGPYRKIRQAEGDLLSCTKSVYGISRMKTLSESGREFLLQGCLDAYTMETQGE